jgi:hypothetical protein
MDAITSPVSPKCQRGSSFVVDNMCSFVLVNPLSATPLFSPSFFAWAALVGLVDFMPRVRNVAKVAKPKICRKASLLGNAPFPLVDTVMDSPVTVSPDLSAMASPTLAMDPSDVARRVVECNLWAVWCGSQRVNLSVCMYVIVKCGGIVCGGGIIKQFLLMFLLLCRITYNTKIFSSRFVYFLQL